MADHPSTRYAMTGIHESAGTKLQQLRNLVGSMGPEPAAAAAGHLEALERLVRADFHLHTDDPETAPGDMATEAVPWPKSKCRSCEAPVIWVVNASTGRRQPVDWEPSGSRGNLLLTYKGIDKGKAFGVEATVVSGAEIGRLDEGMRQWLRTSHFATCPQSDEWRSKPKGGARG